MAMCHTLNTVPSGTLQQEMRKNAKQRLEQMKTEGVEDAAEGLGDRVRGSRGDWGQGRHSIVSCTGLGHDPLLCISP